MAYDAERGVTILFGGSVGSEVMGWKGLEHAGETWIWDGNRWIQTFPTNSPAPRFGHQMTYDSDRKEIVLFGGSIVDGHERPLSNETWVWDGTNWNQKLPLNSPSKRRDMAMVFDAERKKVVLFGGDNWGTNLLNDTWLWNGTNWFPAVSSNKPTSGQMAYDAARKKVVLFTGWPEGQTWLWDGVKWSRIFTAQPPGVRFQPAMVYDPVREEVVMFGGFYGDHYSEEGIEAIGHTWVWNGAAWTNKSKKISPLTFDGAQMVYEIKNHRCILFGGIKGTFDLATDSSIWSWNGTNWTFLFNHANNFDMSSRPSGVWNFTTIDVPQGISVKFLKNRENTPVRWLATGNVRIDGLVDVSAEEGLVINQSNTNRMKGGPGGFSGGLGGVRFDQSGVYAGTPGLGLGGGLPGTNQITVDHPGNGEDAAYVNNAYLRPLMGGSGGGGSSSYLNENGYNGGGGGGAILISSSRDIAVNGSIWASANSVAAGTGAGGAILLKADRISGRGEIIAYSPANESETARIRFEAYERKFNGYVYPSAIHAAPVINTIPDSLLTITQVAGKNVIQPPATSDITPDVVFTNAGPITVTVNAQNIPDGTPVRLRIAVVGQVIEVPLTGTPDILLNGGTATFNATVPKGNGTIQAIAEFAPQ